MARAHYDPFGHQPTAGTHHPAHHLVRQITPRGLPGGSHYPRPVDPSRHLIPPRTPLNNHPAANHPARHPTRRNPPPPEVSATFPLPSVRVPQQPPGWNPTIQRPIKMNRRAIALMAGQRDPPRLIAGPRPPRSASTTIPAAPSRLPADQGLPQRTISRAAMATAAVGRPLLPQHLPRGQLPTGMDRTERVHFVGPDAGYNAGNTVNAEKAPRRKKTGKAGGNRDPNTGELEWPEDIITRGTLLRDFPNVEATGLHTIRSVLKISSRVGLKRREGKRTIEDDDLDPTELSMHTQFLRSFIEKLHREYMTLTGSVLKMLPMQLHQFKRFMLNLGFVDEFIVKRMFETFDVDHHEYLNFVELLVGLSFFMDREKRYEYTEPPVHDHPVFIEFCTKFFDLDGHERMSKFKLYKVCSTCLSKSDATLFADVIYEVISGTVATLTLQQFKKCLKAAPKLRHIMRLLMVLQGLIPGTASYQETHSDLKEVISDWTTKKKAGRSVSMELLIREIEGAPKWRVDELSATAEEFQQARRGMDAVYASYYVQVLRSVIEKGNGHVQTEHARIAAFLTPTSKFKVSEKARQLIMVETAILEGFHECLGMSIDAVMTQKAARRYDEEHQGA